MRTTKHLKKKNGKRYLTIIVENAFIIELGFVNTVSESDILIDNFLTFLRSV